jgi:predicted nucleic acid-binding protein
MLVVKDAMVLIHLAKITVLDIATDHFDEVAIPPLVYKETVGAGREYGYPDAEVIADAVDTGGIEVTGEVSPSLVERANRYNIQGGEAEAVALYWERDADLLASDDDNVRQKRTVLQLGLIGTPSILLDLHEMSLIDESKLADAIDVLRSIGWFSTAILDKIELEAGLA